MLHMVRQFHFIIVILLVLSFCSCDKAEMRRNTEFRCYSREDLTRTQLEDDYSVTWLQEDRISVMTSSGSAVYDIVKGAGTSSATFRGEALTSDVYYALYPYDSCTGLEGESILCDLKDVQTGQLGSFGRDVNVSAAVSDNRRLNFRNVCALLKITLTRSDVSSVVFCGNGSEECCGGFSISFDEEDKPVTTAGTETLISLVPEAGFLVPGVYYMAVLPTDFAGGITIRVTTPSTVFLRKGDSLLSLQRGKVVDLGTLDDSVRNHETHHNSYFGDGDYDFVEVVEIPNTNDGTNEGYVMN